MSKTYYRTVYQWTDGGQAIGRVCDRWESDRAISASRKGRFAHPVYRLRIKMKAPLPAPPSARASSPEALQEAM